MRFAPMLLLAPTRGYRTRTVVLCLVLFPIILFFVWRHSVRQSAEFVVFSPAVRHANGEDPALIVQEVICPRGADHCFKVEDYILREEAASDGTRR
uniref:Mannosyltransferase n=1 Tax=Globodera pallida TaxID=36090 RepID=A0A183BU07_GLOPA